MTGTIWVGAWLMKGLCSSLPASLSNVFSETSVLTGICFSSMRHNFETMCSYSPSSSFPMFSSNPNTSKPCKSFKHFNVCYKSDKAFHLAPLFMPALHENIIYLIYQPYSHTVTTWQPELPDSVQSDTWEEEEEGKLPDMAVNSHGLGGLTVSMILS